MDRVKRCRELMCDIKVIKKAIKNAARGKRRYWHVREILRNLDTYAYNIQLALLNDTYTVSEYQHMSLKTSTKVREIDKLPFYPDRVIQHIIAIIMFPRWDKALTNDTYASWKGRGINSKKLQYNLNHKIKRAICSFPPTTRIYAGKFDIHKCYESTDNDILFEVNKKYCADRSMLHLMKTIIFSIKGLPIGSYLSQLWINILLNELDRYCKEVLKIKYYFRYMDDIVIISDDKHQLHEYQHRIMNFCWYELHFMINDKRQIFPIGRNRTERGIDFVGYVFYQGFTLLRKRIKIAAKRKRNKPESMTSYAGIMRYCNSTNLQNVIKNNLDMGNKLSDFEIDRIERPFEGKKIKIDKVIDKKIIVHDFEVTKSKIEKDKDYCKLQVQIKGDSKKYFINGGYQYICAVLKQLNRDCLPFTTIIRGNRGFYFDGTVNHQFDENNEEYDWDEIQESDNEDEL